MLQPRGDAFGFVLSGGLSRRMGTDKALLRVSGVALVERAARAVLEATGSVAILGDPARYGGFGFPVIEDIQPGRGPLGGIVTGLTVSEQTWNLFLACDMPNVDSAFLGWLLDVAAEFSPVPECVVPVGASGPEPLCAVYHRRALDPMRQALDRNILKMRTVVDLLDVRLLNITDHAKFRNINTPEDWDAHG